jgi:hypothetical protein
MYELGKTGPRRPSVEWDGDRRPASKPTWSIFCTLIAFIASASEKDRAVVIAVGCGHVAAPALGLKVMLAHQPTDFPTVDDDALMTELGAEAAVPVSFELVADHLHATDDLGIVETCRRRSIV